MADTLLTMAQAGITTDPLSSGLQTVIVQEEPLFEYLGWENLPAGVNQLRYFEEAALPTAAFRAVNATWDADYGLIRPVSETLAILGGEIEIDQYIIHTMGGALTPGIKASQFKMKMRAAKEKWLEAFLEGDSAVDANSFDGLRSRVSGTSLDFEMHASDAAAITLEKIDEVLESVVGGPTVMLMNQFLRRKVNTLVRSSGQAREDVTTAFGKQLPAYAETPMLKIQRENDMSSILDFDEDPGDGGDDAASIYFPRFGDDYIHGILGNGGSWETKDFGEQEAAPRVLGRLSVYPGLAVRHPRSLSRLHACGQL
jgi:hypothetical protein